MKKTLIILSLIPSLVFSQQRSEVIQNWVEVIPKKGYILSLDLHNEKMCSKIWTKQIEEFKQMNPHVKNPDIILVNQKIKVQDCRMQIKEASASEMDQIKENLTEDYQKWFIGAFTGANILGSRKNDTSKNGASVGIKIGKKYHIHDKHLSLSLGYLYNKSKTQDNDNSLGVYEIQTEMLVAEFSFLKEYSKKMAFGPKLMVVAGNDISLQENKQNQSLGLYLGGEGLYELSKKVDLEASIQQRIDNLSRINTLANIGVRFYF